MPTSSPKEDLRSFLPRNYAKTIAQKINCSIALVYKVAAGSKENRLVKGELCLLAEAYIHRLTDAIVAEKNFNKAREQYEQSQRKEKGIC